LIPVEPPRRWLLPAYPQWPAIPEGVIPMETRGRGPQILEGATLVGVVPIGVITEGVMPVEPPVRWLFQAYPPWPVAPEGATLVGVVPMGVITVGVIPVEPPG